MDITGINKINDIAPIVIFAYNRPIHIQKTLNALAANPLASESELIIFSDAPKNQETVEGVQAVRSLIKNIQGFKSVKIIERDKNFGLANSIIDGVTSIVDQYGKLIVLEDDLVTSPFFLTYMNDGLKLYENDDRVASIHSYIYPVKKELPDYFFLRGADCLGWATWKRAWDIFNPDAQFLLNEIKKRNLDKLFNFNNSYDYTGMLRAQLEGKVSSWAVRWYASAFLADKYTLYPGTSFVNHIGFDGSGTNCGDSGNYDMKFLALYKKLPLMDVCDCAKARKIVTQYFHYNKKNKWYSILKRIKQKIT
jgi:hypothetical protein